MQTHLPFLACGEQVRIYDGARITHPERIRLGSHVIIDDFVFLGPHEALTIGNYIHLSSHLSIVGGGKVYLSDFSGYSTGVRILSGTDDFSGAGLTNSAIPPEFRQVQRSAVWVGPHVAIGANVVILPGVCIGEGAAVVAGSVVSRDLPPGAFMAAGRRGASNPGQHSASSPPSRRFSPGMAHRASATATAPRPWV